MRHSPVGTWRIVDMDGWDIDAIELLGPALFHVEAKGQGRFSFIAVQGWIDWRADDGGAPDDRIAFTRVGDDEGDNVCGRGWAKADEGDQLVGHVYFHLGDDSGFRAVRELPD